MKKPMTLFVLACCTALALAACVSCSDDSSVPHSGPIDTPLTEESDAIQNAPAYDTEAAKLYIDEMPAIRALVDEVPDESELISFGNASPSEESMQALQRETESLASNGHKISFIMVDLDKQSGVAYDSGLIMCTQSAVKSVYIGSLLEKNPAALSKDGQYMRDALEFSSNDAYENLRELYGTDSLALWCQTAGVDPSFAELPYPRSSSAKDMLKLWTLQYCFLNSGSDAANAVAPYLADSSLSATKKQLGNRYPVQTKAGWESGLDEDKNYDPEAVPPEKYTDGNPENDEVAINDTGVVYTEKGPYLFVIYTDYPVGTFMDYVDVNPLYDLVESLHGVQASL